MSAERLRALADAPGPLVLPGVYDGLSSRLAAPHVLRSNTGESSAAASTVSVVVSAPGTKPSVA